MILDIIMYIFVGLIIVTLCIAFIKMIYDEIKFKKLIGQDLSNYDNKELVNLFFIYERIFKSHILYKDTLFEEEAGRIRVEFNKRIKLTNNKNDNKNMIVFDPHGEPPYNDFKRENEIETLKENNVMQNL